MPEGIPYASSNVVAGTGLELNYIGKHCYAYSGTFAANTTAATALKFTTGNQYIVGEFQLNAAVNTTNPALGTRTLGIIAFNSITVSIIKGTFSNPSSAPSSAKQKVIIPPYTQVTVTIDASADESAQFATVTFSGKIYK